MNARQLQRLGLVVAAGNTLSEAVTQYDEAGEKDLALLLDGVLVQLSGVVEQISLRDRRN